VGGILSNGSEIVGWSAETAPSGAGLIGRPAKLAGTQIPDKATGAYLALPFQGSFGISQLWGENPDIYSRFTYDNVPLRGHNGIDFLTPIGTPVVAVDSGTVAETVVNDSTGFGQYIKVNHNWGEAFYGHLSGISVTPGQPVARGAVLGATGNSGFSFGPHLHFAIRINPYTRADGWGGFADPLPYFDPGAVQLPAYVTASRTAARLEAPSLQTPEGKITRTLLAQNPGYAPDKPGVKRP
jgi:murein DD-endopeptidase MepM/ murein hydrolase activator NlpD